MGFCLFFLWPYYCPYIFRRFLISIDIFSRKVEWSSSRRWTVVVPQTDRSISFHHVFGDVFRSEHVVVRRRSVDFPVSNSFSCFFPPSFWNWLRLSFVKMAKAVPLTAINIFSHRRGDFSGWRPLMAWTDERGHALATMAVWEFCFGLFFGKKWRNFSLFIFVSLMVARNSMSSLVGHATQNIVVILHDWV